MESKTKLSLPLLLEPHHAAACHLMVVKDTPSGFEVAPQPMDGLRVFGFWVLLVSVPMILSWFLKDMQNLGFFSTPLIITGCLLGVLFPVFNRWQIRCEQALGPTLIYDKIRKVFLFPRVSESVTEGSLEGIILVQGQSYGSDPKLITQLQAAMVDGRRFLVCSGTMKRQFKVNVNQLAVRLQKPVRFFKFKQGEPLEVDWKRMW